jgi:hypothetical protein
MLIGLGLTMWEMVLEKMAGQAVQKFSAHGEIHGEIHGETDC